MIPLSGGRHGPSQIPDSAQRPYITVTEGLSGFFAVCIWLNPDMGGFEEPWDTGVVLYRERAEAEVDARKWAAYEGLEYRA